MFFLLLLLFQIPQRPPLAPPPPPPHHPIVPVLSNRMDVPGIAKIIQWITRDRPLRRCGSMQAIRSGTDMTQIDGHEAKIVGWFAFVNSDEDGKFHQERFDDFRDAAEFVEKYCPSGWDIPARGQP